MYLKAEVIVKFFIIQHVIISILNTYLCYGNIGSAQSFAYMYLLIKLDIILRIKKTVLIITIPIIKFVVSIFLICLSIYLEKIKKKFGQICTSKSFLLSWKKSNKELFQFYQIIIKTFYRYKLKTQKRNLESEIVSA